MMKMRLRMVLFFIFVFVLAAAGLVFFLSVSGYLPIPLARTKVLKSQPFLADKNFVFPPNEKIVFGVYSHGFKAGSGDLTYVGSETGQGRTLQHVRFRFNTLSVKDTEDVFGTEDFKYPVKVERHVTLFGRREEILESYSDDHKSISLRKTAGEKKEESSMDSDQPVQNVLLMIYRLRNDKDLDVGKEYDIVLPTQKFLLKVKEKKTLKVPLGRFETFYIESTPAKYKIWISADEKRLPLRIQGLISFGSVYLAAVEVTTS